MNLPYHVTISSGKLGGIGRREGGVAAFRKCDYQSEVVC